jgi:hypothetical protein
MLCEYRPKKDSGISERQQNIMNKNNRMKKNAQRFMNDFGLDPDFGLNGQDFGVSELQARNRMKQQQQVRKQHVKQPPPPPPPHPRPPEELVAKKEALEAFSDDVGSLWCGFGAIPVLDEPPSALTFLRDYVTPSRPCIIRNALLVGDSRRSRNNSSHPSLSLEAATNYNHRVNTHPDFDSSARPLQMTLDDLVEMDPRLELVVDASPDGHADCVRSVLDKATGKVQRLFVTPEQRTMTILEFRNQLRSGRRKMRQKNAPDPPEHSFTEAESFTESDDESDDHILHEEELFEELDGKKIFSFKNMRTIRGKEHPSYQDYLDELQNKANCSPSKLKVSCNPVNDMQDMIMPCLMEFLNNQDPDQYDPDETKHQKPPMLPPPPPSVLYYSRQNDCFRTELKTLHQATAHVIPETFEFAEGAFGTGPPEAVNLWMGDERSVSAMHKDPYENLFYVASGEKIFTLCPPADAPYLYEKDFLSGQFDSQEPEPKQKVQPKKRRWVVKTGFEDGDDDDDDDIVLNKNDRAQVKSVLSMDVAPILKQEYSKEENTPAYVRWIEADVAALANPEYEIHQLRNFPLLKYAHPIHQVRVQTGELLYLPALWFHRVTQSRETIGINYWYNMKFNSPNWCYFRLLQQLQLKAPPQRHEKDGEEKRYCA